MRAGTEAALARVVTAFGSAKPHHAYLFANRRVHRMKVLVRDGLGVWLAARRLNSRNDVQHRVRLKPSNLGITQSAEDPHLLSSMALEAMFITLNGMRTTLAVSTVLCALGGCAGPASYVLPDKVATDSLCHLFVLNDFVSFNVDWANGQRLDIEGLQWGDGHPALSSTGYAVYPAPIGPLPLTFSYKLNGIAWKGDTKTSIDGRCEKGAVLFVHVQTRLYQDTARIMMSSRARLVGPPMSTELLEIYRARKKIRIGRLAAHVLDNAEGDFYVHEPTPAGR